MSPRFLAKPSSSLYSSRPGQSLQEYALPVALIALVALGSLTLLGNQIQFGLNNWMPGGTAQNSPPSSPAIVANNPAVIPSFGQGFQNLSLTLQNGQKVSIANYPTNLAEAVETIGPNGTTEQLGKALEAMADALEKDHPDQANLLRALANSGYDMANQQALITNHLAALKANPTDPALQAQTSQIINDYYQNVVQVGTSQGAAQNAFPTTIQTIMQQKINEIASQGHYNPQHSSSAIGLDPSPAMIQVLDTYQSLAATGALKDPAVAALVKNSLNNIMTLQATTLGNVLPPITSASAFMGNSADNPNLPKNLTTAQIKQMIQDGTYKNPRAVFNDSDMSTYYNNTAQVLQDKGNLGHQVAQSVKGIQQNSGNICITGNGNASSGIQCQ